MTLTLLRNIAHCTCSCVCVASVASVLNAREPDKHLLDICLLPDYGDVDHDTNPAENMGLPWTTTHFELKCPTTRQMLQTVRSKGVETATVARIPSPPTHIFSSTATLIQGRVSLSDICTFALDVRFEEPQRIWVLEDFLTLVPGRRPWFWANEKWRVATACDLYPGRQ